jgi:hypothetical protein
MNSATIFTRINEDLEVMDERQDELIQPAQHIERDDAGFVTIYGTEANCKLLQIVLDPETVALIKLF